MGTFLLGSLFTVAALFSLIDKQPARRFFWPVWALGALGCWGWLATKTYNHLHSHPQTVVAKVIDSGRVGRSGGVRQVLVEFASDGDKHYFLWLDQWEARTAHWSIGEWAELRLEVGPLWTEVLSAQRVVPRRR